MMRSFICLKFIETWNEVIFAAFIMVSKIYGQIERSLHLIA